jgi:DNA-directed RNA polymerase subunit RPC12/RpoP
MAYVCPNCNGPNVRRWSAPAADRTWRDTFYGRYRCRDCMKEFWLVRRKTYRGAVTVFIAILLAILAVVVVETLFDPFDFDHRSGPRQRH